MVQSFLGWRFKFVQMKGHMHPFTRGDNNERAKIYWQFFKIFSRQPEMMLWYCSRCTCRLQIWVYQLYREEQWGNGQYFSKTDVEKKLVCLFVLVFFIHFENCSFIWRLQIWTYTRHSWPLNSEGSLAYQAYCYREHPFIMVISEDQRHSNLLPSV